MRHDAGRGGQRQVYAVGSGDDLGRDLGHLDLGHLDLGHAEMAEVALSRVAVGAVSPKQVRLGLCEYYVLSVSSRGLPGALICLGA